jgi:hypothetical protein
MNKTTYLKLEMIRQGDHRLTTHWVEAANLLATSRGHNSCAYNVCNRAHALLLNLIHNTWPEAWV